MNFSLIKISSRGQFFSPDLIIAIGVFIFALIIFLSASNSVFSQVSFFEERRQLDEVAHSVLNSLVLSPGQPSDWERGGHSGAFSLGLASSNSVLSTVKVLSFLSDLNNSSTYSSVRAKLGLGQFDFYFKILDSGGSVVFLNGSAVEGGRVAVSPKIKFSYKRIVYFNGSAGVFEAIFSRGG